eukprot:gb/GECG01006164.1/.p1 GENE.gb/GECG01006164.1/~~gb/GECG01006164.1/.p1  ORF type:complete len:175 (+),score=27.17 gb/GECG01006164.1/:1-525(+)
MEEDTTNGGDGLLDFGDGSHRALTTSSSSFGGDDAEGMHPSLYRALQMVIARIPGLRLITISNAFGLPVVRVCGPKVAPTADDKQLESLFSTAFAMINPKMDKIGMGKLKTTTAFYNDKVLFQMSMYPLVVSLIGEHDANVAIMREMAPRITKMLEPLQLKAEEVEEEEEAGPE